MPFPGGRFDVGFARAFLPHEFRRFNISPDKSVARFREGLEQIELLLTQENVSHRGQFHTFENVTSLPRPTQKPRPKFYIASTRTRGFVRIRRPRRPRADVDPGRRRSRICCRSTAKPGAAPAIPATAK